MPPPCGAPCSHLERWYHAPASESRRRRRTGRRRRRRRGIHMVPCFAAAHYLKAVLGKCVSYLDKVAAVHGLNHFEPSVVHSVGTKRACDGSTHGSNRIGITAHVCSEQNCPLSGHSA